MFDILVTSISTGMARASGVVTENCSIVLHPSMQIAISFVQIRIENYAKNP